MGILICKGEIRGYKITSELKSRNLDKIHVIIALIYLQNELCCYVSRIQERSVAMENGKLTIVKEHSMPRITDTNMFIKKCTILLKLWKVFGCNNNIKN